jgi:cell division protein FtsQ
VTRRRKPAGPSEFAVSRKLDDLDRNLPRGAELLLLALLFAAIGVYSATHGDELQRFNAALHDLGDTAANAAGFDLEVVEVSGAQQITRDEVLAAAGISPSTSLLLLDAEATRTQLKQNPWIAEATVRKLYPGRLEISIKERVAFAIWQRVGKLSVIARVGTVIGADAGALQHDYPLVVGMGASTRAADFLASVARVPEIQSEFAAAVLVAERRWNIRLKNGTDVRLPEENAEAALAKLVAFDRETRILSRDVAVIDLRIADRITVRSSDEAAQARAAALKARMPKRTGSNI